MAVKISCGRGRFSNFSIEKLLEKGSKGEKEELEEEGGEDEETRGQFVDEDCEIKQEKIELLGRAELSATIELPKLNTLTATERFQNIFLFTF